MRVKKIINWYFIFFVLYLYFWVIVSLPPGYSAVIYAKNGFTSISYMILYPLLVIYFIIILIWDLINHRYKNIFFFVSLTILIYLISYLLFKLSSETLLHFKRYNLVILVRDDIDL